MTQINQSNLAPCDLCGATDPRFILDSQTLDGPLVECLRCGFRYVGKRRSNLVFGRDSAERTASNVREANAAFQHLPESEEHRLGKLNAGWRLSLIQRYKSSGKLLEVGCARGDFLSVAKTAFDVFGVEPNPELASESGVVAPVHRDVIERTPWRDFDVVASFHVIEHVDSPRSFIRASAERLKPGGLMVIETPNIDSLPFRLMKSRWRQFIPEHYFFFDPKTITHVFEDNDLEVLAVKNVGKYASTGLILNRLSRYMPWMPRPQSLSRMTFRINPMDIMLVFATKKSG